MTTTRVKTVKTSGGDYSSSIAWEAGEQANLVTLDEIRRGELYNTEANPFTLAGWVTDQTRYAHLFVPLASRHAGIWSYSKQNYSISTGIVIDHTNCIIEGIQLWTSQSGITGIRVVNGNGQMFTLLYALMDGNNNSSYLINYVPDAAGSILRIGSCILHNTNAAGIYIGGSGFTLNECTIANVTSVDHSLYGIMVSGWGSNAGITNCYFNGNIGGINGAIPQTNCASSDTSATYKPSIPFNNTTFVSTTGLDFHLGASSALRNVGVAASWLPLDIDSEDRLSAGVYSIGADAPPPPTPPTIVTKTVQISGGAPNYTSISAFEAGEQRDLVAANQIAQALCTRTTATRDTTATTIAGWTTSTTQYIDLVSVVKPRGTGDYSGTVYSMDASGTNLTVTNHTKVTGFDFGGFGRAAEIQSTILTFDNCYCRGASGVTYGVSILSGTASKFICNNTVILRYATGIHLGLAAASAEVYNSVLVGSTYGINNNSFNVPLTVSNCYIQATTQTIYGTSTKTAVATSDSVGTVPNIAYDFPSTLFISSSLNAEDFHLLASSPLKGAGVAVSGYATDVDGQTRASPHDIGVDAYSSITVVTKTVKQAGGGDYSSLSAFEAGEQSDLVTASNIKRAECYANPGQTPDAYTVFNGWITSPAYYVDVTVPSGERHAGVFTTSKYFIGTTGNSSVIYAQDTNVHVSFVQIRAASGNNRCMQMTGNVVLVVDSCLLDGGTFAQFGVYFTTGSLIFTNNASYNGVPTSSYGIFRTAGSSQMFIENCTIISLGSATAYALAGTIAADIVVNSYLAAFGTTISGSISSGNKTAVATSDASGNTGLQNIPAATTMGACFVSMTDLHIQTPSLLRLVGVATASYPLDFDGEVRGIYGGYDIGADSWNPGPPTSVPRLVKSKGGHYTSLAAFEAAEQDNLIIANLVKRAECYDFVDNIACDFSGWVTDKSRKVQVYCPDTQGHNGKPDDTSYQLSKTLDLNIDHIDMLKIQIRLANPNDIGININTTSPNAPSEIVLARMIIDGRTIGSGDLGISYIDGDVYFVNSEIMNFTNGFVNGKSSGTTYARLAFDTLVACTKGIILGTSTGSPHLDMLYCYSNTYDYGGGSTGGNFAYNTSSDASAPGINPLFSVAAATLTGAKFVSVTNGAEDFHIKDGSQLMNRGTVSAFGITYDIDGQSRQIIGIYDGGADQLSGYVAATSANAGIFMHPTRYVSAGWQ